MAPKDKGKASQPKAAATVRKAGAKAGREASEEPQGEDEELAPLPQGKKRASAAPASSSSSAAAASGVAFAPCRIMVCAKIYNPVEKKWGQWVEVLKKNKAVVMEPCGDRCDGCDLVFKAREMFGPWEAQADDVNGDPGKAQEWMKDRMLATVGGIKPWQKSTVAFSRTTGVLVKVKLRGLTPAEFVELYGQPHGKLKITLRLLPDNVGGQFWGILVTNDGSLKHYGVRYEWYYDVSIEMSTEKMEADSQIRESQPADVFNWLMKPKKAGGGEDPIFKTMRCAAISPATIEKALEAIQDDLEPDGRVEDLEGPEGVADEEADDVLTVTSVPQASLLGASVSSKSSMITTPAKKRRRGTSEGTTMVTCERAARSHRAHSVNRGTKGTPKDATPLAAVRINVQQEQP